MIKSNPLRYLLFPLTGLALVLSLILIQFSGKSSISHPFGPFTVTGAAPSAPGSDGVSDFNLSGLGINFSFKGNSPLILQTADNTDRNLRAKSYSLSGNTLTVEFQYNLRLRFEMSDQKRLQVHISLPPELEGSRLIRIPFKSADLIPDSSGLNLPVAELRSGNQRYFLILNGAGDGINIDRGYIEMVSLGNRFPSFTILPAPPRYLHAAEYWMGDRPENIESIIDQARNVAYQGWRFSRRRGNEGWVTDSEAPRIDPSIVSTLLSEASHRNQLETVWAELGNNANNWKSLDNLETAAYTGDIVQAWARRKSTQERALSQALQGNWTLWTEDPTLLRDFYFMSDPDTFQSVWNRFINRQALTAEEAIARLEAVFLLSGVLDSEVWNRQIRALVLAAVPWLTRAPNNLILVKNQRGFLDYSLSLRLAALLYRWEDTSDKQISYKVLGGVILGKLLSQANGGLLPRVLIPADTDYRVEGRFGLEEAARVLFPTSNRPRFLPLPSLPGGLAFVRPSVSIVVSSASLRIQSTQSPGLPQFIVIQGVPPFEYVTLHGIRWRSDPSFQSYSDGWLYDSASRTFMAKITNRASVSEIVIQFGPTN